MVFWQASLDYRLTRKADLCPRLKFLASISNTRIGITMLDLFLTADDAEVTLPSDPLFNYLRAAYKREIADVVNYYQQRVYAVRNNHLLARILTTLSIPTQYETLQYASLAETRAAYVSSSFRLTGELTAGRSFDGVFYGTGVTEVLLHRDCYFDPIKASQQWRRIAALQIHRHPQSHLNLLLPNGKLTCNETGVAVISINVALLALQYRGFILEQYRKLQTHQESILGVNHFIHMHVLPPMLYRHMDGVIMNRLMNLFYGAPMGTAYRQHPFLLYDYRHKLDQSLGIYLKHIENKSLRYEDMLRNLPAVFFNSQLDALKLPDYAPTRQVQWSLLLARLPVIQFLIDVGGDAGRRRNGTLLNSLNRLITRLLRDDGTAQGLSDSDRLDYQIQLESLQRRLY
jgi:hypothetical protein